MKTLITTVMVCLLVTSYQAQSPKPVANASFEAATVKPAATDATMVRLPSGLSMPIGQVAGCRGTDKGTVNVPLNRCVARGYSLKWLIAVAYDVPWQRINTISGGPDWLDSVRFDVEAKAESAATEAQLHSMLRELLAERFKLKLHREKKNMTVLALIIAKGGPKLVTAPKDRDCVHEVGVHPPCGSFEGGQGRGLTGRSVDMTVFGHTLEMWTPGLIIDKTGLSGLYDIKTTPFRPENPGPNFAAEAGTDPDSLGTIFNVLPEQLGLRLESQKADVDVIVIDSAERP